MWTILFLFNFVHYVGGGYATKKLSVPRIYSDTDVILDEKHMLEYKNWHISTVIAMRQFSVYNDTIHYFVNGVVAAKRCIERGR